MPTETGSAPSIVNSAQPTAPASGAGDWRSAIPADIAGDPSLSSIKDIAGLAKGYVHAQRMVGADKIVLPKQDAPPEEWGAVWNRLGRPETPDGYKIPEKLPDGAKIDDAQFKAFRSEAHRLGLTIQQVAEIARFDAARQMSAAKAKEASDREAVDAAVAGLRKDWGNAYDQNLAVVREAAKRFGGDDILADPVLGNHPGFIRLMEKVGKAMAQDGVVGTSGSPSIRRSPEDRIKEIRSDPESVKALMNRSHPRHASLSEEMDKLYKAAYPGKKAL